MLGKNLKWAKRVHHKWESVVFWNYTHAMTNLDLCTSTMKKINNLWVYQLQRNACIAQIGLFWTDCSNGKSKNLPNHNSLWLRSTKVQKWANNAKYVGEIIGKAVNKSANMGTSHSVHLAQKGNIGHFCHGTCMAISESGEIAKVTEFAIICQWVDIDHHYPSLPLSLPYFSLHCIVFV